MQQVLQKGEQLFHITLQYHCGANTDLEYGKAITQVFLKYQFHYNVSNFVEKYKL